MAVALCGCEASFLRLNEEQVEGGLRTVAVR